MRPISTRRQVIGSPDGNFLGAALANGEQLQWLRLEIGIRSASVPDLRRELPEEGQMEVFGDGTEVRSDFQTFVVLTVLGKRFRSTSSTGSTPSYQGPYLGKFVAEIPLPVGEKGLARLDTSEIGIDVVEQEEIMKPEPPPATSALTTLVGEGALTTLGLVDEVQEEVMPGGSDALPDEATWRSYRSVPCDSSKIDFKACSIFLPLPPGCWGDDAPTVEVKAPAVVVMDIALRDRTFARLKQAEERERKQLLAAKAALCVGDKAMLRVEEPLAYPLNEVEYRRRGFPGEFQPGRRRGDFWAAPLREPSVSYEYKASGLDQMDPPYPFKQRYMSNSHDDVVPHKFVLPAAEAEFVSQVKPGSYHRIMDMLVAEKGPELQKQQSGETEKKYSTIVVDKLSHLIRHIPVTVLAVYPDQSCDVELASNFIAAWENIPHKPYALQGSVVVGEHMDISEMAIRSAPVGAGDVGERKRRRVLLKGVPLQVVQSVQPVDWMQDLQTALSKSLQLDLQVEATFRLKNIDDEGKAKELIYKGSKVQRCPSMTGSNPCWGETEQLKGSGGWVFKSPLLEKAMMPNLYLEIELSSRKYEKLGMIRFLGGAPTLDLSDSKKLYNNLWSPGCKSRHGTTSTAQQRNRTPRIPLATVDPATAKLTPKAYGELHLMTVWKPSQETVALRRLPKTVRGWQSWELKQALKGTAMHDPIYDVQAVKRGYDPNLYEHQGDHQEAMNEAKLSHMQKMLESIPYLDCCERQQRVAWRDFRLKLESMKLGPSIRFRAGRPSLSLLRSGWSHGETPNTRMLWELDELMRRGELQRKWLERWAEKLSSEADPSVAFYRRLVEDGKPYRNDAMWQLHEDLVAAASWERPTHHRAMARHVHRLCGARRTRLCGAHRHHRLKDDLGCNPQVPNDQDLDANAQGQRVSSVVAYCKLLLVLAFHLVVVQTPQTTVKEEVWKETSGTVSAEIPYFSCSGN
eukprot:g30495.t2